MTDGAEGSQTCLGLDCSPRPGPLDGILLCEGSEEGRSAPGLEEVKVQELIRAEGFSIYYKICYTNTADQKV